MYVTNVLQEFSSSLWVNQEESGQKSDAETFVTRVYFEWRNTSQNWNLHQYHYEMLEFCIAPNY